MITPLKSIRRKCIDCSGHEMKNVLTCSFQTCPLHCLRMGRGGRATMKAIRAFCLWCSNGQIAEVKRCPAIKCSLWQYRFGKRPQKSVTVQEIASREAIWAVDLAGVDSDV